MSAEVMGTVDVRGHVCPIPTIRLGQAIRRVPVGHVVDVWTDDPGSHANMTAWSKNTGHGRNVARHVRGGYFDHERPDG